VLSRRGRRVLARARYSSPSPPRPLTLVLIDDVMTTGETMEACGRVLAEGGVSCVRGLTTARAVVGWRA
jgi:predicted amidophosphoribosyltransferase